MLSFITLNVFLFEQKVFAEQESAELIPFFGSNMAKQIDIVIIISNFRSEFLAASVFSARKVFLMNWEVLKKFGT